MLPFRYAADRTASGGLRVELLLDDARAFAGELTTLDLAGAAVSFPAGACPPLGLAREVRLRFRAAGGSGSAVLAARTRQRRERVGHREYQFQFADKEAVEAQLVPWVRPLLDRRSVLRVRPPASRPIEVRLEAPELRRPATGQLFDLSEAGMAVLVVPEAEEHLAEVEHVRASFVLPGRPPAPIELATRIVIRRLVSTRVQLGLVFLPERSAGFMGQEQAIRRFVIECQTRALGRAG
jgi:hypothetical protein